MLVVGKMISLLSLQSPLISFEFRQATARKAGVENSPVTLRLIAEKLVSHRERSIERAVTKRKLLFLLVCVYFSLIELVVVSSSTPSNIVEQLNDRLQPSARRRQSQATLLSHKQNLLTGSANTPLTSPYNQFYLTNSVNSPHNGK